MTDDSGVLPPIRIMRLRYAGRCACGAEVPAGTRAGWSPAQKTVTCLDCLKRQPMEVPAGEPDAASSEVVHLSLHDRAQLEAGASLAAEYGRRMAKREDRVKERLPRIGGLLLKIFDEADTTRAFKKGAEGERAAVKRLLSDSGPNVLFLVNRRLGKGRRDGDVDVVAVSPEGVTVIDVKRYADAKIRVEREGGLFAARHDVLKIRGRDQSRLLDGLAKQIDAVQHLLKSDPRFAEVSVTGALCFVDADLPLFGRLEARGYSIATAKSLAKTLRESTRDLPQDFVELVAEYLDAALPAALSGQD